MSIHPRVVHGGQVVWGYLDATNKDCTDILSGANVAYTYVDVQQNPTITQALDTILGEYSLPVLFVDGRPYKGVEKVREYINAL